MLWHGPRLYGMNLCRNFCFAVQVPYDNQKYVAQVEQRRYVPNKAQRLSCKPEKP